MKPIPVRQVWARKRNIRKGHITRVYSAINEMFDNEIFTPAEKDKLKQVRLSLTQILSNWDFMNKYSKKNYVTSHSNSNRLSKQGTKIESTKKDRRTK